MHIYKLNISNEKFSRIKFIKETYKVYEYEYIVYIVIFYFN